MIRIRIYRDIASIEEFEKISKNFTNRLILLTTQISLRHFKSCCLDHINFQRNTTKDGGIISYDYFKQHNSSMEAR